MPSPKTQKKEKLRNIAVLARMKERGKGRGQSLRVAERFQKEFITSFSSASRIRQSKLTVKLTEEVGRWGLGTMLRGAKPLEVWGSNNITTQSRYKASKLL